MSGIAGVLFTDGRPLERAALDAMIAATPHLGHHGRHQWCGGPAGLIRFALNTTPESVGETQPFVDPRSGMAIVLDGRIDNRAELRALLVDDAPPASAPDCTIVLAAFRRFGDAFLTRLTGDYALAIWDPARRRLLCARSPVGWRPLLWTMAANRFAFATEPVTLVRGLGLNRKLNEATIAEHLSSRFVTETETFWEGIQRLPPGQALAVENGLVHSWRWHVGPFEDLSHLSDADHIDRFAELFDQALHATMRSNMPVAAQLSGGLDSSTIVCRAHELVAAGQLAAMPRTFSARFPGEACDEGEWIAAVEQRCGIATETLTGAPFDPVQAAQWSAATLHLPLRPNTAGTAVAISNRVQQLGLHVLLTGEGGDDWMNGSRGHWPDLLRRGQWHRLAREGFSAEPGASFARGVKSILADGLGPLVSPTRRARVLRPHLQFDIAPPPWISPDWARRIDLSDRWRAAPEPPQLDGFAQQERYLAYSLARKHVNVDNVLAYVASRGVELRHPFHDLRLTRFFMGAAGGMLRRAGWKKHILREAMRGTLPELVRTRRSKANISPPIIDGVTARLAERPIRDMHCVRLGWVDGAALERFQATHEAWRARRTQEDVPNEPYAPVWNAVAIDLWLEHAFGL